MCNCDKHYKIYNVILQGGVGLGEILTFKKNLKWKNLISHIWYIFKKIILKNYDS